MPFTLSHAAYAVPLARPLGRLSGRRVPVSTLVIGSWVPDIAYMLPAALPRSSHTLDGLLWFCLPVGWLCYLLWHHVIRAAVCDLMPMASLRARLARFARPGLPTASVRAVSVGLLVGSISHLLLDGFTHQEQFFVQLMPFLQMEVLQAGSYHLPLYNLLQHVLGIAGLVWVGHVGLQALGREASGFLPASRLTHVQRRSLWLAFALGTLLVSVGPLVQGLLAHGSDIEEWLALGAFRTMSVCGVGLVAYGLVWQRLGLVRPAGRRDGLQAQTRS
ncbi:DUF4184 family protein [Uliginosibacterium sp. H1]|uniref:DUF4184 family protein n=1 Tax=Uliginosibacterium sp. H1 TaxID=3114757 RepID=UPI002E16F556|nr:DUF4184 family protein [Uliginosibacterium sp. H1]